MAGSCRYLNWSTGVSNVSEAPAIASEGHWISGMHWLTFGFSSMALVCLRKISGPMRPAIDTQRSAIASLVFLLVNPSTTTGLSESKGFPDLSSLWRLWITPRYWDGASVHEEIRIMPLTLDLNLLATFCATQPPIEKPTKRSSEWWYCFSILWAISSNEISEVKIMHFVWLILWLFFKSLSNSSMESLSQPNPGSISAINFESSMVICTALFLSSGGQWSKKCSSSESPAVNWHSMAESLIGLPSWRLPSTYASGSRQFQLCWLTVDSKSVLSIGYSLDQERCDVELKELADLAMATLVAFCLHVICNKIMMFNQTKVLHELLGRLKH